MKAPSAVLLAALALGGCASAPTRSQPGEGAFGCIASGAVNAVEQRKAEYLAAGILFAPLCGLLASDGSSTSYGYPAYPQRDYGAYDKPKRSAKLARAR